MEYRKLKQRDVWHFMPTCQHWKRMTASAYVMVEVDGRPASGELCNECLGKQRSRKTN